MYDGCIVFVTLSQQSTSMQSSILLAQCRMLLVVVVDMKARVVLFVANKNDAMNQLKLALAWNRIDVVREEIFTEDKTWDVSI